MNSRPLSARRATGQAEGREKRQPRTSRDSSQLLHSSVGFEFDSTESGEPSSKRLKRTRIHSTSPVEHDVDTVSPGAQLDSFDDSAISAHMAKPTTRLMNGIVKEAKIFTHPHNQDAPDRNPVDPEDSEVLSCAALLASIDRRSYDRARICDANAVLENITFPMSFPWAHAVDGLGRMVPRDIDVHYGVMSAGNPESTLYEIGRFECLKNPIAMLHPASMKAATSRSDDPGVIRYMTIYPPTMAQQSVMRRFEPFAVGCSSTRGELSLRAYEEVELRRKQRDEFQLLNLKTRLVSIRVGCTSSRSKILESTRGRECLSLIATMPSSVQNGWRMNQEKAHEMSQRLGSYNCGSGLSSDQDRVRSGRTRLVWSERDRSAGNYRYKSMLTGESLENGAHKRPRMVMVGVRINGCLLSVDADNFRTNHDSSDDCAASFPAALLDEAIEHSYTNRSSTFLQCTLDRDKLIATIAQVPKATDESVSLWTSFSVRLDQLVANVLPELCLKPPQLDCLPTEEGIMHVVCTVPGRIIVRDASTVEAQRLSKRHPCPFIILEKTASERSICSVCWTVAGLKGGKERDVLLVCSCCGLVVHRHCCCDAQPGDVWTCSPCSEFQQKPLDCVKDKMAYQMNRWSLSCHMCGQTGGSLASKGENEWVHNVCAKWRLSSIDHSPACSICGNNAPPVVKCAADNCRVVFHPTCALILSNAAELVFQNRLDAEDSKHPLQEIRRRDEFLCTQYRLAQMELDVGATGDTYSLPVAFCGYHNPDRLPDLYGLYPGGRFFSSSMRIPPIDTTTEYKGRA